jgi:hypothetical protein
MERSRAYVKVCHRHRTTTVMLEHFVVGISGTSAIDEGSATGLLKGRCILADIFREISSFSTRNPPKVLLTSPPDVVQRTGPQAVNSYHRVNGLQRSNRLGVKLPSPLLGPIIALLSVAPCCKRKTASASPPSVWPLHVSVLLSHNFMPPSSEVPDGMVLAEESSVVATGFGKVVTRAAKPCCTRTAARKSDF